MAAPKTTARAAEQPATLGAAPWNTAGVLAPAFPDEPELLEPGLLEPGLLEPGVLEPGVLEPGVLEPGVLEPGMTAGLLEPELPEEELPGQVGHGLAGAVKLLLIGQTVCLAPGTKVIVQGQSVTVTHWDAVAV